MTTFQEIKARLQDYVHQDIFDDEALRDSAIDAFFCEIDEDVAWLIGEIERLRAELGKFYECNVQNHYHGSVGRPGGMHTNDSVQRVVYHKEGS